MDQVPLIWTRTLNTTQVQKEDSWSEFLSFQSTHILVGGLVGADQVGVEAWEANDGPDGEETHHHLQDGAELSQGQTGLFDSEVDVNLQLHDTLQCFTELTLSHRMELNVNVSVTVCGRNSLTLALHYGTYWPKDGGSVRVIDLPIFFSYFTGYLFMRSNRTGLLDAVYKAMNVFYCSSNKP